MKIVRIISALLALVGLAFLAAGVDGYRTQAAFLEESARADGEVTEAIQRHRSTSRRGSTYYTYRVRFRTSAGDTIEGEAMEDSAAPLYIAGEKVAVFHSRSRPTRFTIDDFMLLWGDVTVMLVIAAMIGGAGAAAFRVAGGRAPGELRTSASLGEMARAWREGRLNRNSEYQGMLVAFALAAPAIAGAVILFVLFVPGIVQIIFAVAIAWFVFQGARARRAAKKR